MFAHYDPHRNFVSYDKKQHGFIVAIKKKYLLSTSINMTMHDLNGNFFSCFIIYSKKSSDLFFIIVYQN